MPSRTPNGARDLLDAVQTELAAHDAENQLVPLIADGTAPRSVFGLLAAEERHIVPSDWRSFHLLAARSDHPAARSYFAQLAGAEETVLRRLEPLADAAGRGPAELAAHAPLAVTANFAAWGGYCAAVATGMREHYGCTDDACGFFDFFAAPQSADPALAAIAAGLAAGTVDVRRTRRYARLVQTHELAFWNTLSDHRSAAVGPDGTSGGG